MHLSDRRQHSMKCRLFDGERVSGALPSQRYGPFGVVGRSGPITLFDTPNMSGTPTGRLPTDSLVWIACHVIGEAVSAPPEA